MADYRVVQKASVVCCAHISKMFGSHRLLERSRVTGSLTHARRGLGRIGTHPDGFTPQSGCPAGSVFQNMILSK